MTDNNPFPDEDNTGHIWDDNIRELNNPPPRWWMLSFWASIAWFVGYVFLYPSWPIGNEPSEGILGWTQIKELNESMAEVEAVRAPYEDKIKSMTAAQILADPGLSAYTVASVKVLFGDNCGPCHGSGGQGAPGFPVIADDDWLYGGSIAKIEESITKGRKGVMPAHGSRLSAGDIDTLASYVVGLSKGQNDPEGKALFMKNVCFACHGPTGTGNQAMGSANLADSIWRFEPGGVESARMSIAHGINDASDSKSREAVMPMFGDKLSADEIKKLAVYVHKLGGGQ
ncbi:Cytochrome c oxidase (cbb3-type) subunit CcoP [hydrothermal vent metagenome]|uniref:Cytochrome c oxidase subunit III n=1 Tax=hydrothermal vent metagenome TaxID=652676 RepID=A0A3B1B6P6_9ZZZZ